MLAHILCRSALATLALGLIATTGIAAAQANPDPKQGAFGGASYGGVVTAPVAPPVVTPPAAPPAAPAAVEVAPVEPVAAPAITAPMEARQPSLYERWGIVVALGGGVEGFASADNTKTQTGGGWNVRATIGTKSLFGFEASYFGSAQSIDALGLSDNAVLVGNGVQGSLRLNLTPQYDVGVFLLGGLAWRHYDLANTNTTTADVRSSDDVMEVPVGAGVQYVYRRMLFDVRGDYRFTRYSNMMVTASSSDMNRWGVQGNIGYQF